jgi:hypothetical protein
VGLLLTVTGLIALYAGAGVALLLWLRSSSRQQGLRIAAAVLLCSGLTLVLLGAAQS